MAKYYNKTNGPLTLGLRDGSSALVSPKSWISVYPHQDGSTDLIKKVQKGYLVRKEVSVKSPSISKTASLEKVEVMESNPIEDPEPNPEPDSGSESESVPATEPHSGESAKSEPEDGLLEGDSETEDSGNSDEVSDAPIVKRKRRRKI